LYGSRAKLASAILHAKAKKCKEPIDFVHLANAIFCKAPLKYVGWCIGPNQVPQEIKQLLTLVHRLDVHRMLEIGTYNGGTLFLFSRMVNRDAKILSLDLPGGKFGGGYPEFKAPFFSNFAVGNQKIYLLRENSHLPSSKGMVGSILVDDKLDFLFIDGDHTYEGVKKDFEMYSPLVRKGGLIAFHDICKHPPQLNCTVDKFWNEIKGSYDFEEIIDNPSQNWAGIGVLHV
jgi:predicted O-methyltransferase YrrM